MPALIRSFGTRRIAVVVLAIGLVGLAAVPTILAAPAPPTPGQLTDGSLDQAVQPARIGRLMRGDVTVLRRDGSTVDLHFERGRITAASPTSVTLAGADGTVTTFSISTTTRIRVHGAAATAGALKVGDLAMALGTKSGSGYQAVLVRDPKPAS
jgi:hypothetical protein